MKRDLSLETCLGRSKPLSVKRTQQSVERSIKGLHWLDAPVVWRDGRVGWRVDEKFHYPTARDLSAAAQHLENIQRHNGVVKRRFDDYRAWYGHKQFLLGQARLLLERNAPDLVQLCSASRSRNPRAILRLSWLLSLEALSVEPLPRSPALALLEAWPLSAPALHSIVADQNEPDVARALAAMVIGAATILEKLPALPGIPWLRRCMLFGREYGLPENAPLCCHLLRTGSLETAWLVVSQSQSAAPHELRTEFVRELAHSGKSAAEIIALQTAVSSIVECLPPISFTPIAAPKNHNSEIGLLRREWNTFRKEVEAGIRPAVLALARQGDPELISRLDALVAYLIRERIGSAACIVASGQKRPRKKQKPDWVSSLQEITSHLLKPFEHIATSPDPVQVLNVYLEFATSLKSRRPETDCEPHQWAGGWAHWLRVEGTTYDQMAQMAALADWPTALRSHRLGILHLNHYSPVPLPWLETMLELAQWCDCNPDCQFDVGISRLVAQGGNPQQVRQALRSLLHALDSVPVPARKSLLSDLIDAASDSKRVAENFVILHAVVDFIKRLNVTFAVENRFSWLNSALVIGRWRLRLPQSHSIPHEEIRTYCQSLIRVRERVVAHNGNWDDYAMGRLVTLLCALPVENETTWENLLYTGMQFQDRKALSDWQPEDAISLLRRSPWLQFAILRNFESQPKRCLKFLADFYEISAMPDVLPEVMAKFQRSDWSPLPADSLWAAMLSIDPSLSSQIRLARFCAGLIGNSNDIPESCRRALYYPEKLARERDTLRELTAAPDAPAHLRQRFYSLQNRISNTATLRRKQAEMLHEALEEYISRTSLELAEASVDDCFRTRLSKIAVRCPQECALTEDLRNAARLSANIYSNRKWLRAILRFHLAGDANWLRDIPGNMAFLDALAAREANVACWLAPHEHTLHLDGFGKLHISIENDPIKILQMGNPFETCLSHGGCNAFSAVSNAVELNKRVVYARDTRGRIVARQLWALNQDNALLGFMVYSNLEPQAHSGLARHFAGFALQFATACGLQLGNSGEVPLLFAADWYDDGVVDWELAGQS